ncbi:hypothetical protein Ancab_012454 [Ancistrocladus abbreviatus]
MGDKKEDEHITIPMPVHETSYQPSLPLENANPEIMLNETSQLTPSGDASSTIEPPPHGDAPLSGVNKSTDDQWTPECVCLLVVVLILFILLVAYLICNKDVTEDATEETQDERKMEDNLLINFRETSDTDLLFRIVRWSLVSVFIFSICWPIKEALLLKWSADAIYDRFSKRILRAGFQLYFLCLISGSILNMFKPKKEREMVEEKKKETSEDQGRSLNNDIKDLKQGKVDAKGRKRERKEEQRLAKDIVKDRMLSEDLMTIHKIRRVVKIFITLVRLSSRGQDDDISDTHK